MISKPIWVTGRKYYQENFSLFEAGERGCELVREPDNTHDSNAVMVTIDNIKVGYIPASLAMRVAPLMDTRGVQRVAARALLHAPDERRALWGAQVLNITGDADAA